MKDDMIDALLEVLFLAGCAFILWIAAERGYDITEIGVGKQVEIEVVE